ncbi:protein tonB [Lysobacter hankyongensis]|uniref:Protein tonB n=1 Tax=Lysobacter hankyongensis TaxID=1176535 RepID=A0ABP9C2J1_9GAMM
MRLRTLLLLCLLPLVAFAASAADKRDEIRRQAESSLSVSGTIDITAEGKVVRHALDAPETLPKGIVDMTARLAPQWTFEPVQLPAGTVSRSKMSLLYVAKRLDNGDYRIELRSANFASDLPPEAGIRIARRGRMPAYPENLVERAINGTVYLVVQIGRDGKVMNIDATHVNLRTIGSEDEMAQWRDQLAQTSIKAIRGWTFEPPTTGPDVDAPHWFGTLPVAFTMMGQRMPKPGKWETYIPGPRRILPWQDSAGITADNADALAPNQLHTQGSDRRLLSPLGG